MNLLLSVFAVHIRVNNNTTNNNRWAWSGWWWGGWSDDSSWLSLHPINTNQHCDTEGLRTSWFKVICDSSSCDIISGVDYSMNCDNFFVIDSTTYILVIDCDLQIVVLCLLDFLFYCCFNFMMNSLTWTFTWTCCTTN